MSLLEFNIMTCVLFAVLIRVYISLKCKRKLIVCLCTLTVLSLVSLNLYFKILEYKYASIICLAQKNAATAYTLESDLKGMLAEDVPLVYSVSKYDKGSKVTVSYLFNFCDIVHYSKTVTYID